MTTLPRRRSTLRLPGYDYRTPAAYFVTICTAGRRQILHKPRVRATVEKCWAAIPAHFPHAELDVFVVMPNHVHGILHLLDGGSGPGPNPGSVPPGSLSAVIRSFKAATTKELHALGAPGPVWQRNYYDRIITDQRDLERLREYVANNPANWAEDPENPERDARAEYLRAWSWVEAPEGAAVLRPYAESAPSHRGPA